MKISISPSNPVIYLNEKTNVQVNITESPTNVEWISVQIVGKVEIINEMACESLSVLVDESLGGKMNAPFFSHIMSGSFLLDDQISIGETYLLSIYCENLPPSFKGAAFIHYELRISAKITNELTIITESFPIQIIAPCDQHFILKETQNSGVIQFDVSKCHTIQSLYVMECPYDEPERSDPTVLDVCTGDSHIAMLTIYNDKLNVGEEFAGLIDSSSSDTCAEKCKIVILCSERYSNGSKNESIIAQTEVDLREKNEYLFANNLSIPHATIPNFSSDFVSVSYSYRITFTLGSDNYVISNPLFIYPKRVSTARVMEEA